MTRMKNALRVAGVDVGNVPRVNTLPTTGAWYVIWVVSILHERDFRRT